MPGSPAQHRGVAMPSDEDLVREQAYLDRAQECLELMRARAQGRAASGAREAQMEGTRDAAILLDTLERRHAMLADAPGALAFGRLDEERGERFYVGRRHIEDDAGDPVVVDWRADVSIPFYRATWADPLGLAHRRRFALDGRELVGFFDEDFTDPDATAAGGGGVPDPLLAELERARTGEMRDIVATIQAEQDVVIRAPLEDCIVVQGGPGTGKTAVGLHRAAFLLYEHRRRLERERLLVVGPNRLFLRYISQVLPSLGETSVVQTTLAGLLAHRYRVRAHDEPDVARLKGDARMATVIRRAATMGLHEHARPVRVRVGSVTVGLPEDEVARLVALVVGRGLPLNQGREQFRRRMLHSLFTRYEEAREAADEDEFLAVARRDRSLTGALDRLWPSVSAPTVVRKLFGSRRFLAAAGDGVLDAGEQRRLYRPATRRLTDEHWTRADLALLDEADDCSAGTPLTFGHVVVDEAQDLSPMELRVVGRRCPSRSMTALGDLAQATTVGGQRDWQEALAHLGAPDGRVAELELGYRVPAPILDLANRLLPLAAPGVRPARSVRLAGEPPRIVHVAPDDLAGAIAESVRDTPDASSIGIIAPTSLLERVANALADAAIEFGDGRLDVALGDRVTLLPPVTAKGLEFDAVTVVEPARIVGEEPSGLRVLYVALTRAVRRLTVVHTEPLPAALVD